MDRSEKLAVLEEVKRYMFAEDIISYFMINEVQETDFRTPFTSQCVCLISRAFNDLIKTAIRFLFDRISDFNVIKTFETNNMVNETTFHIFANCLKNKYFFAGYNAQKFLYFCSYLAYIAISFYKAGISAAPELAVKYIFKSIKIRKVHENELWNKLSVAALMYIEKAIESEYIKISDVEAITIQFVIPHLPENINVSDSDGGIESDSNNKVKESDILTLASELKTRLSSIGKSCVDSEIKQKNSKLKEPSQLNEESTSRDISSDNCFPMARESFKSGEKKYVYSEKDNMKCLKSQTKLFLQRIPSSKRRDYILGLIYGMTNEEISSFFNNRKILSHKDEPCTSSKDLSSSVLDKKPLENSYGDPNVSSINHAELENALKNSKYFDESEILSSFFNKETVSHITRCGDVVSALESMRVTALQQGQMSSKTVKEDIQSDNPTGHTTIKESFQDCRMEIIEFDLCDPFFKDVMLGADEVMLFGETHQMFISKEDYFNCTFDIIEYLYSMSSYYDAEFKNVGPVHQ